MTEIPRDRLQREWALYALVAAAARFVPVPLLDDVIKGRATRTAVARTWRAHARPAAPEVIGVLSDDTRGLWRGLGASALRLPLLLVLYPVRKVVRLVTAGRGVGRDLAEVLLLARAVDRCLGAGWFSTGDRDELVRQAQLVRQAHERTVTSADLRVLEQGLRTALRRADGLRRQATRFARRTLGRDAPDPLAPAGAGGPERPPGVERGADEVQAVLARPDVAGTLDVLDRRFDAALAALTRAVPPSR